MGAQQAFGNSSVLPMHCARALLLCRHVAASRPRLPGLSDDLPAAKSKTFHLYGQLHGLTRRQVRIEQPSTAFLQAEPSRMVRMGVGHATACTQPQRGRPHPASAQAHVFIAPPLRQAPVAAHGHRQHAHTPRRIRRVHRQALFVHTACEHTRSTGYRALSSLNASAPTVLPQCRG